jgi:hypothetical protein
MEKNARVEIGRTPSIHSGRPSDVEHEGETVCKDELRKKASLSETDSDLFLVKPTTSQSDDLREWAGLD